MQKEELNNELLELINEIINHKEPSPFLQEGYKLITNENKSNLNIELLFKDKIIIRFSGRKDIAIKSMFFSLITSGVIKLKEQHNDNIKALDK